MAPVLALLIMHELSTAMETKITLKLHIFVNFEHSQKKLPRKNANSKINPRFTNIH